MTYNKMDGDSDAAEAQGKAEGKKSKVAHMFKNKLVRDRFDKKKGSKERKEAIAKRCK